MPHAFEDFIFRYQAHLINRISIRSYSQQMESVCKAHYSTLPIQLTKDDL